MGWRTTYRKEKPEMVDKPKQMRKLKKKAAKFQEVLKHLPLSCRSGITKNHEEAMDTL